MRRRRLNVQLDGVADVRAMRRLAYPDPVAAAIIAQQAGAHQISVHLREDRQHVQERDVRILRQTVHNSFNLQLAAVPEMLKYAFDIKPDQITLVAQRRDDRVSAGGVDVVHQKDHLKKYLSGLSDADIPVALVIDPDLEQVRAAHRLDAAAVELHTAKFAQGRTERGTRGELQRLVDAAKAANKLGLRVSAGGGLNYDNITKLTLIDEIDEFCVGHSLVSRALLVGFDRAVRDMLALLND